MDHATPTAALDRAKADAERYGTPHGVWRHTRTGAWRSASVYEAPAGIWHSHALTVSPEGDTLSTGPAMRHVGRVA